jgi:hypothetical protein
MATRCLVLALIATCLAGCASRPRVDGPPAAAAFVVQADDYAAAFEVAQAEVLRRFFELERVDAQAGVILSRPKTGAGVLAPWTLAPSSRLMEDTLNAQTRTIEVRFEAAENVGRPPTGVPDALADPDPPVSPARAQASVVVSVRVLVSRRVSPTRRLEPSAIRFSGQSIKPELFQRGLSTIYHVPRDLDAKASASLAGAIERRLFERLGRRDAHGGAPDQGGPGVHAKLAVQ